MTQLEKLYRDNRKRYVNMMSRILRHDRAGGEDVVQEAFCRALKFYGSYDERRGKLETWFNTILFNSLRDNQRASKGSGQEESDKLSLENVFNLMRYRQMILIAFATGLLHFLSNDVVT